MRYAGSAQQLSRKSALFTSLLLIPFTPFAAAAGKNKTLLLASQGTTPTIVTGAAATASEKFAAQELAHYLGKMTGHTPPVVDDSSVPSGKIIAVGKSKLTSGLDIDGLGVEQFITDVQPNRLTIVGGRRAPLRSGIVQDRGTLYGVYEFLDKLGVRWYRPEEWGEFVPTLKKIEVPTGRTTSREPWYWMRSTLAGGYTRYRKRPPGMQERAELWSARNRLNWNEVGTDPKLGGKVYYYFEHNFAMMVPKDKYFAQHPEYFAVIKGKRDPNGQLCTSNPEVQEICAQYLIDLAKTRPELDSIPVVPNDGDGFCECPVCKALDNPKTPFILSNRIYTFMNILARKVNAAVPGMKVHGIAYSRYTEIPDSPPRLEPNSIVQLCSIDQLYDENFPLYGVYSRKLRDPENTPFRTVLKDWATMKPAALMTYEYWSGYGWPGPLPLTRTIADRLRNYSKYNVRGFYNENHSSWGPQGLDLYMTARLAWNPDLDVNKELDLYYRNFYGPAAKPMKRYHEDFMDAIEGGMVYSGGRGMHLILTPSLIAKLEPSMRRAQELVKGKPLYERRLAGVAAGYEFSRRVSEYMKLKKAIGVDTPLEGYRGSYLAHPKVDEAWKELVKFAAGFNDDAVFDIDAEDAVNKDLVSPALAYMWHDLQRNGVYVNRHERETLKDF